MWSSTPIDAGRDLKRPGVVSALGTLCLALAAGCSQAGETPAQDRKASPENIASTNAATVDVAAGRNAATAPAEESGSRVLGERDFTLRGAAACEVRFVYAGRDAENLFWEEPCAAVSARMMTQRELEGLGKWDRLDGAARTFINALPGGRVLYVEGGFSASVYPVGTSGTTYEVAVAD
jgi:hypothetical protein